MRIRSPNDSKPSWAVAVLAVVGLACASAGGGSRGTRDHASWSRHVELAREAEGPEVAAAASIEAFAEALRFGGDDARVGETRELCAEIDRDLRASSGLLRSRSYEKALVSRAVKAGEPLHALAIWARRGLAATYAELGRRDAAERILAELLEAQTRAHGPDDGWTLDTLALYASTVGARDPDRGLALLEGAADRAARAFGPTSPLVGNLNLVRGRILLGAGRIDEAHESLSAALEIAEEFGRFSMLVAVVALDMGLVAVERGELERALGFLEQSRSVYEANDPRSPGLASTLNQIARVQRLLGDVTSAHVHAARALELAEETGAPAYTRIGAVLLLASLSIDVLRFEEAEALADRGATLVDAYTGLDPTPLAGLAEVERRLGRTESAIRRLREFRARVIELRGVDSMAAGAADGALAHALGVAGNGTEAEPLAASAERLAREHRGEGSLPYARALAAQSAVSAASGDPGRALVSMDRSLETHRRILGDLSPLVLDLEVERAHLLRMLGDEEEARRTEARVELVRAEFARALTPLPDVVRIEVEDRNFRLELPGADWIHLSEKTAHPPPSYGTFLSRALPRSFFQVSAWAEPSQGKTLDAWLEELQLSWSRSNPDFELLSSEPLEVAGVPGRLLRAIYSSEKGGRNILDVWYGARRGFYYELLGSASATHEPREEFWRRCAEARRGFEPIDPERVAGGEAPRRVLTSERFGYALDPEGRPWARQSWAGDVEIAELQATDGEVELVTLPVLKLTLDVDDETFARAMVRALGFQEPEVFEVVEGSPRTLEYRFSRTIGGANRPFRVRVYFRDDTACLVAAAESATDAPADLSTVDTFRWEGDARVLEVASFDEADRVRHARVFDFLAGRWLEEKEYARAIEALQVRLGFSPDDVAFREQLAGYEIALGRHADAIRTLEPLLDATPDRPTAWLLDARARRRLEGPGAAVASYRRAFELGLEDEVAEIEFVDVLWESGRREEALARVDAALARSPSRALRLKRASLRREKGELDDALSELEDLANTAPGDLEVLVEIALVQLEAARYREAIDVADLLVERAPTSWEMYYLKAQAETGAGLLAAARESLDRAASLNPESVQVGELQSLVLASLGEGGGAGARRPLEPVPLPDGLLDGLPATPPVGAGEYGAFIWYGADAVRFEDGVLLRRTSRIRFTVLDRRGLEQFSSLRFAFDPLIEEIFVNRLAVYDADGSLVAEGDPLEQTVLDAANTPDRGTAKVLNVPIPGLAMGRDVEVVITYQMRVPPERLPFQDFLLSRSLPAHRSLLYVEGDLEDVSAHPVGAVVRRTGEGWVSWSVDAPIPLRWEPLQSAGLEHVPRVRLADARDTWEELARGYLAEIQSRLDVGAAADALLPAGGGTRATDDPERALEIARAVQAGLRYEAIEFGPRARMPKRAADTVRDRYGDCKDHSVVLVQLLRRAGYDADLALVSAVAPIDRQTPSLDQFDHMAVFCGDCPGTSFIDATDKDAAVGRSAPRGLSGRWALVLDERAPRLERIPEAEDGDFSVRIDRTAKLTEEGTLAVRESVVLGPYVAAPMRATLRSTDRGSWAEGLQGELLAGNPRVADVSVAVEGEEQVEQPLRVHVEYALPGAFTVSGDKLLGNLPFGWESAFLAAARLDSRASPFELPDPLEIVSASHLELPGGHSARLLRAGGTLEGKGLVRWTAETADVGDGLRVEVEVRRARGVFPAAEYDRYVSQLGEVLGFLGQPVEVEPR